MPVLPPEPGGGDEYSAPYQIISIGPDVELRGTTDVQDVQEIVAEATTSGTVFTFRLLPEVFNLATVNSFARQFAGYFDAIAALPNVTAVSTFQDINDADQLDDVMRIIVRSTSGISAFPIEEHQFGRQVALIAEQVAAVVAQLDAIEASH